MELCQGHRSGRAVQPISEIIAQRKEGDERVAVKEVLERELTDCWLLLVQRMKR